MLEYNFSSNICWQKWSSSYNNSFKLTYLLKEKVKDEITRSDPDPGCFSRVGSGSGVVSKMYPVFLDARIWSRFFFSRVDLVSAESDSLLCAPKFGFGGFSLTILGIFGQSFFCLSIVFGRSGWLSLMYSSLSAGTSSGGGGGGTSATRLPASWNVPTCLSGLLQKGHCHF